MNNKTIAFACDHGGFPMKAAIVAHLEEKGYKLEKVCPVDQFGHTGHVETVCSLSKA